MFGTKAFQCYLEPLSDCNNLFTYIFFQQIVSLRVGTLTHSPQYQLSSQFKKKRVLFGTSPFIALSSQDISSFNVLYFLPKSHFFLSVERRTNKTPKNPNQQQMPTKLSICLFVGAKTLPSHYDHFLILREACMRLLLL